MLAERLLGRREDDPHQLMAETEDPINLSDDSRGHGLAEICEHLDHRSTHRGGQHRHLQWLTEHRRDDQEILAAIWKSRYPRHHHRMHRRRGLRGVGVRRFPHHRQHSVIAQSVKEGDHQAGIATRSLDEPCQPRAGLATRQAAHQGVDGI